VHKSIAAHRAQVKREEVTVPSLVGLVPVFGNRDVRMKTEHVKIPATIVKVALQEVQECVNGSNVREARTLPERIRWWTGK
jgi:hypothetical protein